MKLLQSFWSLPSLFNKEDESYGRNKGGWPNERYHAISWALSCLKFKEFYSHVTLYTDNQGQEWLGDRLGLPYSEIIVELDSLNSYDPMLWALPKVYVYGRQQEPFIHGDGDVFIWKKLPPQIECSGLICQNLEYNSPHYKEPLKEIQRELSYIPDVLRIQNPDQEQIVSINAGIIGGTDYGFFQDFSKKVFSFIDSNSGVLDNINIGNFNLVYEQLFFYRLADQGNMKIFPLLSKVSEVFEEVLRINTIPMFNSYAHTVGHSKRNVMLCMEIEARLKYEFPLVYQHISALYSPVSSQLINGTKTDELEDPEPLAFAHSKEFISRTWGLGDLTFDAITKLIDSFESNPAQNSKDERLLVDLYQIESAWKDLNIGHKGSKWGKELFMEKIWSGLDVLYGDRDVFLDKRFVLDSQSCRIIGISHQFDPDVEHEYLRAVTSGQISIPLSQNPDITLVEDNGRKIRLTRLEGWDILLYYFEDNPMTGAQLSELIRSGQTPFTADEHDVEEGVMTFMINNAFNLRRLMCVRPTEV